MLDELSLALDRLEEALDVPQSAPLAVDGTIQRFEFVFELSWKAMKALVELHAPSADVNSARAAIKAAYAAGWIDDEAAWLDLLEMRNATSQTYRESLAVDIYRPRPFAHAAHSRSATEIAGAVALAVRCGLSPPRPGWFWASACAGKAA